MRMDIKRNSICIVPGTGDSRAMDEAYIEEVLGLKKDGEQCICKRVNAHRLSCIAYIKIEKEVK